MIGPLTPAVSWGVLIIAFTIVGVLLWALYDHEHRGDDDDNDDVLPR